MELLKVTEQYQRRICSKCGGAAQQVVQDGPKERPWNPADVHKQKQFFLFYFNGRKSVWGQPCFLSRFLPGGEPSGSLPEVSGLPGQNQGWEDHAGHGESSVLLLPAEVSGSRTSQDLN